MPCSHRSRFSRSTSGHFVILPARPRSPTGSEGCHFTLPESLWEEKAGFFRSFGFSESTIAHQQYRLFERELSCSAPFEQFWRHAEDQLPAVARFAVTTGYVDVPRLVMSIRPKFARAVMSGDKRIEIRKSFSERWIDQRVCIYSSSPDQSLVGEATITSVIAAAPEDIWASYGSEVCCDRAEFDEYVKGASKLVAIRLSDVRPYERPVSLQEIRKSNGGHFFPPQSYRTIEDKDKLHSVFSIAGDMWSGPMAFPVTR